MNKTTSEVMDILQEECAEVIQAVSKIRRFGIDNAKPADLAHCLDYFCTFFL